jgi:predicted NBD/HSP70 family sugar kinase
MNTGVEYPDNVVPGEQDSYKKRLEGLGVDQEKVRNYNRQLILRYLREHGPTPRVAISQRLGLSRATVSSIVWDLIDRGFVLEGKKMRVTPRGGKRATEVHFNANAGYIVGIDLGRSHLRIYLTNLAAEIVGQWASRFDTKVGWEDSLQLIAMKTNELLEDNQKTWDLVRGIGLSIPGSPDPTSRMLISPPLLSMWMGVDIPGCLRQKLDLNEHFPIYLDNDANMGAIGESRYGAGYGVTNLIYVKLSTSIGAGLILNGQLYRGNNGVAGEFGHVIVEHLIEGRTSKDSPSCPSCGKRGCLEAVAGLRAIVNDARQHSTSAVIRSIKESDITPDQMADVIIEAQQGGPASRAALELAGRRIGTAIGSYLINVYDPSVILIDGGIVRPGKGNTIYINHIFLNALYQSAEESSLPAAWVGTKLSPGALGDDAVGLGAVANVLDKDPELTGHGFSF